MNQAPVVQLEQGDVRGVWRDIEQRQSSSGGFARSAAFLGIPFAEAPTGEHRFGSPVPARAWDGVRDATTFGPTPQRRPFGEVTAIPEPSFPGEATLNVNVFTPAPGQDYAKRPVLVWIHGGGYKAGSPCSPWYDGISFNRDGIVTVSVSYRLGFDGFGWIPDAPHNRGLLDQIEALRWVRRNISAFGGDPDRITIAGQSAGGGSVLALMISPPAEGLFHAAISHSGGLSPHSAAVAQDNGRLMAELAGVEWSRAGLSQVDEEKILDLQEQVSLADPPADLDAAVGGIFSTGGMQLAYLPYLDGQVLPATVDDSLAAGVAADLPLIMGAVAHEFTAAAPAFAPLLAGGDLRAALAATPLSPVADDYLAAYQGLPGGEGSALGQLISDLTFRVPMVRWADLRGEAPTWLYDFRLAHPDTGLSAHCAELPFAWDLLDAPQVATSSHPEPPQSLADAMHGAWVEFNRSHQAPWPAWSVEGTAMIFDTESEARPAFAMERRIAEALEGDAS